MTRPATLWSELGQRGGERWTFRSRESRARTGDRRIVPCHSAGVRACVQIHVRAYTHVRSGSHACRRNAILDAGSAARRGRARARWELATMPEFPWVPRGTAASSTRDVGWQRSHDRPRKLINRERHVALPLLPPRFQFREFGKFRRTLIRRVGNHSRCDREATNRATRLKRLTFLQAKTRRANTERTSRERKTSRRSFSIEIFRSRSRSSTGRENRRADEKLPGAERTTAERAKTAFCGADFGRAPTSPLAHLARL